MARRSRYPKLLNLGGLIVTACFITAFIGALLDSETVNWTGLAITGVVTALNVIYAIRYLRSRGSQESS
jgi:hypothetical protein